MTIIYIYWEKDEVTINKRASMQQILQHVFDHGSRGAISNFSSVLLLTRALCTGERECLCLRLGAGCKQLGEMYRTFFFSFPTIIISSIPVTNFA